jgi:excinuclease UvrABC nuclease subunit
MVSKEIGEVQLKRRTTSTSESESVSNSKGGGSDSTSSSTSESEQTVTERIVLPAEIMGLPKFFGYLRTGGSHRVAKVKVEFDGIPRRGDQEDFAWRAQRALPKRPVAAAVKVEVPERQQQQQIHEIAQSNQEEAVETHEGISSPESYQDRLSALASALMRESFERWEPEAIAALTDEEMTELSGIFVERAEIALANAGQYPA